MLLLLGILVLAGIFWFGQGLEKHNREMAQKKYEPPPPRRYPAPVNNPDYAKYCEEASPVVAKYPEVAKMLPASFAFRSKAGQPRNKEWDFMANFFYDLRGKITRDEILLLLGKPDRDDLTYRLDYGVQTLDKALLFEIETNCLVKAKMKKWPQ
jgi:hypothetical protein